MNETRFDDHSRRIAVLIPCRNEALTIASVVGDFNKALPAATVYVYDNQSEDNSAEQARLAGAIVRHVSRHGKGYVVKRMLADVDADIYVLVDGDATYQAQTAPEMIQLMLDKDLDLVNARRVAASEDSFPSGHRSGNRLFTLLIGRLFGRQIDDVLSGYKTLSRRFAKSLPVLSGGFEIETEITVQALTLDASMAEVDSPYQARPAGSSSKLRTIPDGLSILRTVFRLTREERPMLYYSVWAIALALLSIGLAIPLVTVYLHTGLVPRFPTAILCTGIMLTALLSLACGVVLDSVKRGQREIKRILYLQQK